MWLGWKQLAAAMCLACGLFTFAQEPAKRQAIDDAWWTGPMLAPSANSLPRGHFLIEPYVFDVISHGHFDADGTRRPTSRSNTYGNLTYINYGVTDHFTVGLIPTEGYSTAAGLPDANHPSMGDVSVLMQYRFTKFREGHKMPIISAAFQEKFPTGKYDRLGDHATNAQGSGAHTHELSLYTQDYFWLPNGRILRTRFNMTQAFSTSANVRDQSVYGTPFGFRGEGKPGDSFWIDSSWEYSVTRRFVLATDLTYEHDGRTRVRGVNTATGSNVAYASGTSDVFGVAPAIEYSWRPNLGVLLGVRLFPAGRNTSSSITPAIAINFFR